MDPFSVGTHLINNILYFADDNVIKDLFLLGSEFGENVVGDDTGSVLVSSVVASNANLNTRVFLTDPRAALDATETIVASVGGVSLANLYLAELHIQFVKKDNDRGVFCFWVCVCVCTQVAFAERLVEGRNTLTGKVHIARNPVKPDVTVFLVVMKDVAGKTADSGLLAAIAGYELLKYVMTNRVSSTVILLRVA